MKLYYTKRSPYGRKARIMALEKKIALELVEVDLANKPENLYQANPLGKIPVLELADGRALCDSPLICEYLDGLSPEPKFLSREPRQRLLTLNLAAIADGLMDVTIAAYMEKQRHAQDFHQRFVQLQEETVQRCLAFFDQQVQELEPMNLASVGVISAIGYIQFRVTSLWNPKAHSRLASWYEKQMQRPSFQSTIPG